jgi:anti-sigma factor RsiW
MHLSDDELVLHYYGEMPAAEEPRAAEHLAACDACQQNYSRLQRVMAFVDSAPPLEAPDGFERIAWARLEPALPSRRVAWLPWFVFSPARLAWVAGIVLLIVGAFIAGRISPRTGAPSNGAAQTAAAEKVRERILLVDLSQHLDRSQMVLVELVSGGDEGKNVDISSERARAEQLLANNRLYRQTALNTGDRKMAALLDELERVLVDVAAAPSTVSQSDLESIRARIQSQQLLFKVGVVSSQVHEREKAALQSRRPLDSSKS